MSARMSEIKLNEKNKGGWRQLWGRLQGDATLTSLLTFVCVLLALVFSHSFNRLEDSLIVVLVLGLFLSELVLRQPAKSAGLIWAVLVAQFALIEGIIWLDQFQVSSFLLLMLPLRFFRYLNQSAALIATVVLWFVYLVQALLFWWDNAAYVLNAFSWTVALVFLVSRSLGRAREKAANDRNAQLVKELAATNQQLQEYARQVEELSATQERNRIAREIHDTLGHHLTALNVQLEKALVLYEPRPQEAYATLTDTKQLASEALKEVRRSVATLREPSASDFRTGAALAKLVETARQISSFEIKIEVAGTDNEPLFPYPARLALYRVAQEGLTNIRKYAEAQQVEIELRFSPEAAVLTVQDDGRGFEPAALAAPQPAQLGGYGLAGLRERLALLGGRLEIESTPGVGTRLTATINRNL